MGKLDQILQLQENYLALVREARTAEAEYEAFKNRYGSPEVRKARLAQLRAEFPESLPGQHGEFDSRHNLRTVGKKRRWTLVFDCSDCERMVAEAGLSAARDEMADIRSTFDAARELAERIDALWAKYRSVAESHTELEGLLPSYYLRLSGAGRILEIGPIENFTLRGRRILDEGRYVDYDIDGKTARAVFDSSEQLVAYHLGDENWTVTPVGDQRWEKYSSSRSGMTDKPQTDLYFGKKGDKGGHIAINDSGDIEHVRDDDGEVLYNKFDEDNPYN